MSGVPGPMSTLGGLLVEDAVQTLLDHMRNQFNVNLEAVFNDMKPFDGTATRNLPFVEPDRFYFTEGIDPLQCPAVFIVPDRTDHDNAAQNFIKQEHHMMVGLLVEDIETATLARVTWRYVRAAYRTLHDQAIGNLYCLVESIDYGPIFRRTKGDGRQFRKDATLRLRVTHMERF
jgi:hypothetical protein